MSHRYIVLVYNRGWSVGDRQALLETARSLASGDVKVIDCRVASQHIEFDVYSRAGGVERFLSLLSSIFKVREVKEVVRTEELRPPREVLDEAVKLFNAERFWESHEVLEGLWRKLSDPEKRVIQGIILLAAAYVHLQKGETQVYHSILSRARTQMEYADQIYGLDLTSLKRVLDRLRAESSTELVKISLSGV